MTVGADYQDYASIADIYDYIVPYASRPDVSFFVEAAKEAGSPVLEIGCGTGRVLLPTARAGITIVGVDRSPHMLAVCRQRLKREPESVRAKVELVLGDMRQFDLGRVFSLATVPFRPFQHLVAVDDQLSCLKSIHRHLNAGGRLILDLFNPSLEYIVNRQAGEEYAEEPEFSTPDGRRVVRRHKMTSCDRFNQIVDSELVHYVTYPDGREERVVQSIQTRYFFRFEVEHLLARTGFEVEQVYADYDKSEYGSKYPGELIFVARKAGPEGPALRTKDQQHRG